MCVPPSLAVCEYTCIKVTYMGCGDSRINDRQACQAQKTCNRMIVILLYLLLMCCISSWSVECAARISQTAYCFINGLRWSSRVRHIDEKFCTSCCNKIRCKRDFVLSFFLLWHRKIHGRRSTKGQVKETRFTDAMLWSSCWKGNIQINRLSCNCKSSLKKNLFTELYSEIVLYTYKGIINTVFKTVHHEWMNVLPFHCLMFYNTSSFGADWSLKGQ